MGSSPFIALVDDWPAFTLVWVSPSSPSLAPIFVGGFNIGEFDEDDFILLMHNESVHTVVPGGVHKK